MTTRLSAVRPPTRSKIGRHPDPADPTLYAVEEPHRRIRAVQSKSTITVYQAHAPEIGLPAVHENHFPAA
ncbi:hypothetical protein [Streptomyces sp. NPDC050988]|uniref:hypothetical protein n=1 Tax=Streptomyces sp. NPDC050988 TaxID=3365637 RepID=UPI0037923827